eukprot:5957743-Prymnesium_polylepis.1
MRRARAVASTDCRPIAPQRPRRSAAERLAASPFECAPRTVRSPARGVARRVSHRRVPDALPGADAGHQRRYRRNLHGEDAHRRSESPCVQTVCALWRVACARVWLDVRRGSRRAQRVGEIFRHFPVDYRVPRPGPCGETRPRGGV